MAGRLRESIVSRKVKLTLLFAGAGSLITIIGGAAGIKPLFAAGLAIVAASPYLSLAIVLRREKEGHKLHLK